MNDQNTSLLFVSGAGLPPWIWDETRAAITNVPTTAVAPRPNLPADLAAYARSALDAAPTPEFTVVAHSVGAVIALKMHELAPERIAGILAISGAVPPSGGSFLEALPFPNRVAMRVATRIAGTRPPDKAIRIGLCSSLDEETADRIVADFVPESRDLFVGHLEGAKYPVNTGYVKTMNDKELPPKLQDRCLANLQPRWTQSLPTGHLPMLETPAALASAIDSFTRETA